MPSLSTSNPRFLTPFEILEGGAGTFLGELNEPSSGDVPSYQFNLPRRLLQVGAELPVRPGMVLRDREGTVYMVGQHGAGESHGGTLFRSFRLFEAPKKFEWKKRGKTIDPVTLLPTDTGLLDQPEIWGCYEPATQEAFDRQIRASFETGRFITTTAIERDDVVDGRKVSRVDLQLGLYLCTLG